MPPTLLLASTSRYRHELFGRLGVPFRAAAHRCDEDAFKARGLSPQVLAETLALAKAESLRDEHPAAVIVGSDQVAAVDGILLSKPGTAEAARQQLRRLAGRTHTLVTAVAVVASDRTLRHTDVTRLTMRPLTKEAIARYVATDAPLDCAGSYRLESRGITLFTSIESADHTAIVGLPLLAVTWMLVELGFMIP